MGEQGPGELFMESSLKREDQNSHEVLTEECNFQNIRNLVQNTSVTSNRVEDVHGVEEIG